jgi:hypothetical protein
MTLHALWHFNEKSPAPVRVRWEGGRLQASRQAHTQLHHPIHVSPASEGSKESNVPRDPRSLLEKPGPAKQATTPQLVDAPRKTVSGGGANVSHPSAEAGSAENGGLLFGLGRLIFGEPVPLGFTADLDNPTPEEVSARPARVVPHSIIVRSTLTT